MEFVVNVKDAIVKCFKNYAVFNGRASRFEFWSFSLFCNITSLLLGYIADGTFLSLLTSVFAIAVIVPSLAVAWRRLHDIGKSGAAFFISFIPVVGLIIYLVWMLRDSQPGENAYGPNPKDSIEDSIAI